ncbi:DNA internalization-related competence protein ComEC/Rec2 [Variovorax sp.]|jgi:competence protein ComEC|uniref:DNA internalization-related competence protein ComEC/Rec2 n=1 Tax=Variovorax sp. TaxID=1871043 RepID=UPI000C495F5D|nr:DNA internalization-related competence protein ComEC/Rec2 [Variovorax sp.]MBS74385.1 DNA internalization-related competence protein ComEC/Rec2 [Variovorax sp.]
MVAKGVRDASDAVVRARCAFVALAAALAGVALQLRQPVLWDGMVYAGGLLAGIAGLWSAWRLPRHARTAWVCAALAGAAIGAGLAGARATVYAAGALDPALEGRDLQLVGVVSQMPQRGDAGTRFRFAVESARWADPAVAGSPAVPDRIALGWYAEGSSLWNGAADASAPDLLPESPVHAGERWRLTVRLKAPHGHRNPHGFDSELWMWEQGLRASGHVRIGARDEAPARLGLTGRHPVERAREVVRDAIFARVPERFAAGVIAALVTGDQGAIDREGWDVFRATGVAHLMSISGLHVTLFAWLAAHVVGALWRRGPRLMLRLPAQRAALVGGVLLATLYALFSGWGVPAQRTVWMLATVALLRLTGRRWPWPHGWLLTAAVVVAFDPWALTQAGFWLSFVAVGVLFATDAGLPGDTHPGPRARLWRLLREQWTITLALTPLSLLLFQQVSLVGLVANLVAIPWVTLVITPLAMLGTVAAPLWELAARAVQVLGLLLSWLAALPFASISMAAPPAWLAACGVAGGVLAAMRLPWSLRALGLPLLLPVLLWQPARPALGEFELLAADVGQGNAVLVRTANHSLLYDSGPRYSLESDAGQRVLVPLLRALGERLDLLVLSHRDSDHTGGASAVLAMHPRAGLLSSIEAEHPLQSQRRARRCEAGQRWTWDGVDFELLHPRSGDYLFLTRPNAISCVLRIGNGRATALLAGDIERLQEAALLERVPERLRADVLLVPHHGSRTSSSAAFLDAVRPRIGLVQAGYRNRFGHPVPEVTARHAERGVRLVENVRCGAAHWSSARPVEVGCERERASRYWQHRPVTEVETVN